MSLTLNMVGGGGGGLKATDAILRVIAPAQSVVTISKGSVSKSDVGHENADDHTLYDYYFIIHQSQFDSVNPWTVTAASYGGSKSTTIVIDAADEYDVLIIPRKYLYNLGEQYTTLTGGWTKVSSGTLDFESDHMLFTAGSSTEYWVATANAIDLTYYSTLTFSTYCPSTSGTRPRVGTALTRGGTPEVAASVPIGSDYADYVLDVSNLTGQHYIQWSNRSNSTGSLVNKIYVD